ncbi:putative nucleotidyltransferase substrate binding domain-containing protein [Corynebacterium choanae]|uniref:Nucleotidyltransferase substrate binding domain protein n=1 Tax=Corynebacterium choanae TaxID=1862358 RepID=A0A3G6J4R7_9CORY|nr:putative nucleotidyltransferase substrate binding domain-containing protein [Corynebacterium choanae]AZA13075.1 Putative nucleotidyltransferase substrate binding domain protein [Corynebacterium choanae]
MLHDSLEQLRLQAHDATTPGMLHEIATESLLLLRRAIAHDEPAVPLASWLAEVVTGLVHSPAAQASYTGEGQCQRIVTGLFGQGLGIPTAEICWLNVADTVPAAEAADHLLADTFREAGFAVHSPSSATTIGTRETWQSRLAQAVADKHIDQLCMMLDAGSWMTPAVLAALHDRALLQAAVLRSRPPQLKAHHLLPASDSIVDVRGHLITPLSDLARYIAAAAGSPTTRHSERIDAGVQAGVITAATAESLQQCTVAGLQLVFSRFAEGVADLPEPYAMVPQLERSMYGASCRNLSTIIAAVLTSTPSTPSIETSS